MRIALVVAALVVSAGNSPAFAVLVLPDLPAGTLYRLAFVTSATRDGSSPSIADYNSFVTGVANTQPDLVALGTTWTAIGSTVNVSAIANTMTDPAPVGDNGVPIFRLDGVKIADHYDDLWDMSLDASLSVNEMGSPVTGGSVLAGSTSTGIPKMGGALGTTFPQLGILANSDVTWIDSSSVTFDFPAPLYAMSGVLTAVPEARAWLMLGIVAASTVAVWITRARWARSA